MIKKIFISINIILFSLILFQGWKFFRVWLAESALSFIETKSASFDKPTPKKDTTHQQTGVLSGITFEGEGEKLLSQRESFAGVIEKNLFHLQRKEAAEEVKVEPPVSPSSPPQLKPKPKPIILEGIVIFGNYKAAVIKEMAPQSKGGRPTRRVRVGDIIEEQKVIAIKEDQIIVKGEEGEKRIKLYAPDKPARPQITERPPESPPRQEMPGESTPTPPPPAP